MTMTESTVVRERSRRAGAGYLRSRRFALVDLGCALIVAASWYVTDGRAGPWPLLVAGLPWVVRLANGKPPVKRTRFDWFQAAFLLTAAVGVWASYDPSIAWGKFWLLVGAVVLFYALAGQPSENIWPVVAGLGFFAAAVAVYFLLTHDWLALPAKIELINTLGLRWAALRPALPGGLHALHPNVAGGIMAMLFPFLVATGIREAKQRRRGMTAGVVVAGLLVSAGLVATTSRGAWLALLAGMGLWGMWAVAGRLSAAIFLSRRKTLALCVAVMLGAGLFVAAITPGGPVGLLNRLPGPANAGNRLEVSRDAVDLIGDFPLTGGGLGSFDGLYSQYIRVIPYHYLIHSHNLFLNVGLEQGIAGLLLLMGMLGAALWWLADPAHSYPRRSVPDRALLSGALVAVLAVVCIHGLVDDPLYGSRGVLLLWVPVGLAAIIFPRRRANRRETMSDKRVKLAAFVLLAVIVLATLFIYRAPFMAQWYSNLGAVEMARAELDDYPSGEWETGPETTGELAAASAHFSSALAIEPGNRTAWHRLGLIALKAQDFEKAKNDLYNAYLLDRNHRGIRKSLGYATLWAGDPSRSVSLLVEIPEAADELTNYIDWWQAQGRDDLSRSAEEARHQLLSLPSLP